MGSVSTEPTRLWLAVNTNCIYYYVVQVMLVMQRWLSLAKSDLVQHLLSVYTLLHPRSGSVHIGSCYVSVELGMHVLR